MIQRMTITPIFFNSYSLALLFRSREIGLWERFTTRSKSNCSRFLSRVYSIA